MKGFVYKDGNDGTSFIPCDAVVRITEHGNFFDVWFAKGYTNSNAKLSKEEIEIVDYNRFLSLVK